MPFAYSDPEFSRAVIAGRAEPGRESPRGSVALWTAAPPLSAPDGLSARAWESGELPDGATDAVPDPVGCPGLAPELGSELGLGHFQFWVP